METLVMQIFALIFVTEQNKTNPAKTGANGKMVLRSQATPKYLTSLD